MPSELLIGFIKEIWAEIAGRIFLLTVIYYLFSILAFSGYLSQFANGFSGLAFNDFTFGDLLFFFPTIVVAIFYIIVSSFWKAVKAFLIRFLLPILIGFGLGMVNPVIFPFYASIEGILWVIRISFIIWYIGLLLIIWIMPSRLKQASRIISFILQGVGSFLFFATINYIVMQKVQLPQPTPMSSNPNFIFDLFWVICVVVILFTFPIILGRKIATTVIEGKLLSKVSQLQLTMPVNGLGNLQLVRVTSQKQRKVFWNRFRPVYDAFASDVYQYTPEADVFLVASFNKVTALYVVAEAESDLLLLSNNMIRSYIIKSDRKHT